MAKKSAKASNDNGNLSDKENGTGCVSWSSLDDEILMKHLKAVKEKDGMSDNGFKRTVWVAIAELLAQQAPSKVVKTATKCQDHWTTLKANYNAVHKLRTTSGFGWDEGTKVVVATDAVWVAYIEAHRKAKHWRNTPFPLDDDIHFIVDGVVATGAAAFHPRQSPPTSPSCTNPSSPSENETPSPAPIATQESRSRLLYNADAKEIMTGDSQDVPKTQAPLPTTKQARDHSLSPSPGASTSAKHSCKGRCHAHGADSMLEVASAIRDMSKTFITSGLPTLEQHQQVIQLLEDDGDFSDNEQVHVMGLFADNMAIADTFMHIGKKNVCTTFIRSKISDCDL